MIKFRAGNRIYFGLSDRNVELLREGKPVHIEGVEIGLPHLDLYIFHGATEQAMFDDLVRHGLITPLIPGGRSST